MRSASWPAVLALLSAKRPPPQPDPRHRRPAQTHALAPRFGLCTLHTAYRYRLTLPPDASYERRSHHAPEIPRQAGRAGGRREWHNAARRAPSRCLLPYCCHIYIWCFKRHPGAARQPTNQPARHLGTPLRHFHNFYNFYNLLGSPATSSLVTTTANLAYPHMDLRESGAPPPGRFVSEQRKCCAHRTERSKRTAVLRSSQEAFDQVQQPAQGHPTSS